MIVAFSGVDGAGKSTQINRLNLQLEAKSKKVVQIWSRGGYTPIFEGIKIILRILGGSKIPQPGNSKARSKLFASSWKRKIWVFVAILDLMVLYGVWFRLLSLSGYVVLADRFIIDSELDFKRNFPSEAVNEWISWKILKFVAPVPDRHFLLMLEPNQSKIRCASKEDPFPNSMETLIWRYNKYIDEIESNDMIFVDCSISELEVNKFLVENLPT